MPSKKVLDEKKNIVSEIKSKVQNSKSIVLFDYRGLTDNACKNLRVKLRDISSDYKVYKNTLLKLAFHDLDMDLDQYLEGPTAIAFSQDDVGAVKILSDVARDNEALVLKAGVIEGEVADKTKLSYFASIPSREGLYTMLG